MKELLLRYVKYNFWANERLTGFICDNCSEEQADKEIISSFISLRQTLIHIWGAECIWLLRLKSESPTDWKWSDFKGTLPELQSNILNNNKDWILLVESSNVEFLESQFQYKNLSGKEFTNKVSDAILHCMNHSTFHRGQLVTQLRHLGFTKLVPTDFIEYCRLH